MAQQVERVVCSSPSVHGQDTGPKTLTRPMHTFKNTVDGCGGEKANAGERRGIPHPVLYLQETGQDVGFLFSQDTGPQIARVSCV